MMKQILFKIGNGIYGIDVYSVMGIEKNMDVMCVPNAPQCIEGIINLRGDVIPVFSLREKFNLDPSVKFDTTEMIIAKAHGMTIALEVDEVKEIVEIEDTQTSSVPKIIKNEHTQYIKSVAEIDNKLVLEINLDGILDEAQKEGVEALLEEQ